METGKNIRIENTKPTRARMIILAMVFVCVIINYMDRSNVSIAAPMFSKELHLSSVQLGLIFSAFGWAYALLQIPGGICLDKFGSRVMNTISLGMWSLSTLLQAFVKGFPSFLGLRISLGIFEAPAFPTNNRVVTTWFPENERASAIGFYTSGQFVGLAFLTPLLVALQNIFGWRALFVITGVIGMLWAAGWYFLYRDPKASKWINERELNFIRKGGAIVDISNKNEEGKIKRKFTINDFKIVLTSRKLWGIYIGQFAVCSTLWFFLTWFPTYLVEYRHLGFIKMGFLASLPFLAAFCGVIISGIISDSLIKKGVSVGIARKTPIIFGLLLSTSIVAANFVESPSLVVLFMTLAFLGNGLASITWVFVSTIAPIECDSGYQLPETYESFCIYNSSYRINRVNRRCI
ncbi:glucarate transporter [Clostridiaceae bacterium BL-3]|nr:glucarate transporter [Clostridiaceae bacterium BL-3]